MSEDLRSIAERVKRECRAGLESRLQLVDAERLADFALSVWASRDLPTMIERDAAVIEAIERCDR